MTILLTGASGFVGKVILKTAQLRGLKIRPVYRSLAFTHGQLGAIQVAELDGVVDWSNALLDVSVVIHTAARSQVMDEKAFDSMAEYRRVNVEGTLNLARQAASVGVRRFVFISSIKVNGESTAPGDCFTADDIPAPVDAYALTKAEVEVQLMKISQETGMEVTIIRPPLIYGPGVKGNLAALINFVRRGVPLPLGGVTRNRRSLVGLDNLVDLILVCTDHPSAANQTFLVSDGDDLSTTELLRKIGAALGRPVRLVYVPTGLISLVSKLLGRKAISQRLLGSLKVDIRKTCELLNWSPRVAVDEGLRRALR